MRFDDRIRAMARGRGGVSRVPFPFLGDAPTDGGEPVMVGVRLLLDSEIDQCKIDALQYVRGAADTLKLSVHEMLSISPELLDREEKRMVLYQSFLDVDTLDSAEPQRFFMAPGQLRQLDALLVDTLMELYLAHQNEANPLHGLDEGEVAELVDALGKVSESKDTPIGLLLGLYDAPTLRHFVRILIVRHKIAPTDK